MSEPFIGEIKMFAGNFAPRGWAMCSGQLLAVSQNNALFSLLGTTFGGDGRTTFGLPELRGRLPVHVGQGPGLSSRPWGQKSGNERFPLSTSQFPTHSHALRASTGAANAKDPTGAVPAETGSPAYGSSGRVAGMNARSAEPEGTGQLVHNNMQPCLTVHFIIALVGIFPSRN